MAKRKRPAPVKLELDGLEPAELEPVPVVEEVTAEPLSEAERRVFDETHPDPSRRRTPDEHGVQAFVCGDCGADCTNYARCWQCGSRELLEPS